MHIIGCQFSDLKSNCSAEGLKVLNLIPDELLNVYWWWAPYSDGTGIHYFCVFSDGLTKISQLMI